MTIRVPVLALSFVLAALAGCSNPAPEKTAEPGIRISATLEAPADITVRWRDPDRNVAGHIVEFATEPGGPYTILRFLPPDQTAYRHPDLIPGTTFYYRVRPFYGTASSATDISLPPGPVTEQATRGEDAWVPPRVLPGGPAAKHDLRAEPGAAAPTGLKGTVMHANGIRFTWTDHATGEEGYLVEVRPRGAPGFGVAAVLDPDINSFGLTTLPDEKTAAYRVRAYYYGSPSGTVRQRTRPESPS